MLAPPFSRSRMRARASALDGSGNLASGARIKDDESALHTAHRANLLCAGLARGNLRSVPWIPDNSRGGWKALGRARGRREEERRGRSMYICIYIYIYACVYT